jgi:hypothetical protein
VISGIRSEVHEICALQGYKKAYNGYSFPNFRDKMLGPIGRSETSVRNSHYTLRNIPEECGSQDHYILLVVVEA